MSSYQYNSATGRENPLKLGIIGCGYAGGSLHLPALQHVPEAKVTAISDNNPEQLDKIAARFAIKQCHRDYREMLADSSLDVIAVLTPAQFHIAMALDVLAAGKHLLVEKPLALCVADCDRLIAAARSSERKIMVGFNLRYHRLIEDAKKMIHQGVLGVITAVNSTWTSAIGFDPGLPLWRIQREQGGGTMFDLAVHHFDGWRHLLDSEVEEIFAFSNSERKPDESVSISARMQNGVIISGLFGDHTSAKNEIEIYGQNGRLRISLFRFDGLDFYPISSIEGGVRSRLNQFALGLKQLPLGIRMMKQGGDYPLSYQREWRHFLNAIRTGHPVKSTLEDGRTAVQIVVAANASAATGKPVRLTRDE